MSGSNQSEAVRITLIDHSTHSKSVHVRGALGEDKSNSTMGYALGGSCANSTLEHSPVALASTIIFFGRMPVLASFTNCHGNAFTLKLKQSPMDEGSYLPVLETSTAHHAVPLLYG
jgi:hypothetical protein